MMMTTGSEQKRSKVNGMRDNDALKEDIANFLEELRESGDINMYGAGPVLMEAFDLNKREAREALIEWMESK